jgi:ubiquinone/menaquinone biosynthesis C-methylase UbiE
MSDESSRFKQLQRRHFDDLALDRSANALVRSSTFDDFFKHHFINTALLELSAAVSSGRLLDLGSGEGKFTHLISDTEPGVRLICADISLQSLRRAAQSTVQPMALVVCDAENLPFQDQSFDAVMSVMLLHHLPNLSALHEYRRVVSFGGRVLIIDIVSDNWLRQFMKWAFHWMPGYARRSIRGDVITSQGEVPDTTDFPAASLRRAIEQVGLDLIKEERHVLFMFAFQSSHQSSSLVNIWRSNCCGIRALLALVVLLFVGAC